MSSEPPPSKPMFHVERDVFGSLGLRQQVGFILAYGAVQNDSSAKRENQKSSASALFDNFDFCSGITASSTLSCSWSSVRPLSLPPFGKAGFSPTQGADTS